jgi:hypothetical protein
MDDWKSKQGILSTVDPDDLDAHGPLSALSRFSGTAQFPLLKQ